LELKSKHHLKNIHPYIGFTSTIKGATYTYFGLSLDFAFKNGFLFFPSLAAGYYNKGRGRDLGYPLEFRSSLFFGYQKKDKSRFGILVYHISNASIVNHNPGSESFLFLYSYPF
jgi:lipid A 3-O-deacylase